MVTNTNDAPSVTSPIADSSTDEDALYSFDISSAITDVDVGDTLTYAVSGSPSWMSMSSTGTLSGTPLNADVGSSTITVSVTDAAGASASDTFVLTVANTNDAPTVVVAINDLTVNEDSSLSTIGVFTDQDVGDTLTYSMSVSYTHLTLPTKA